MLSMMGDQPVREPNELIIWSASGLLAALAGFGGAMGLWMQLHYTKHSAILTASVVALSLGLGLIGVAVRTPLTRVFLVVAAATMLGSFFLASPAFALFGL